MLAIGRLPVSGPCQLKGDAFNQLQETVKQLNE